MYYLTLHGLHILFSGDGMLTLTEFEASIPYAIALADGLFHYYDNQHSGKLSVLYALSQYNHMDVNRMYYMNMYLSSRGPSWPSG